MEVSKLTADNWYSWEADIKVLLMDRGCYSFINDTEPPLGDSASRKEILDYNLRKNRAYSTIYSAVSPQFRELISKETEGKAAYKILKDYFEPSTRAHVVSLLDEFFSIRFDQNSETIPLFCARLKNCVQRLKDAGHELESLYQSFQLIRYLPPEFSGIVQSIYRWDDKEFKFDKVAKELSLEENRLTQTLKDYDNQGSNVSGAYGASIKSHKGSGFKSRGNVGKSNKFKKNGPCYNCGEFGHLKGECDSKNVKVQGPPNRKGPGGYNKSFKKSNKSGFVADNVEVLMSQSEIPKDKYSWCMDSGATHHFCNNRELFYNFKEIKDVNMIMAVGGLESPIEGKGDISFQVNLRGKNINIEICDVLYSPKLRRNLMSCSMLESCGAHFIGCKGKLWVYTPEEGQLFYAKRRNGLYILRPRYNLEGTVREQIKSSKSKKDNLCVNNNVSSSSNSSRKISSADPIGDIGIWHKRFCHVNNEYLLNSSKNSSVKGLPLLNPPEEDCVSCKLSKSKRVSYKSTGKIRSKKPLELLHMDVCGPMPVRSAGGNLYFLSIIDDYSRKVSLFPMKNKSEVFEIFKSFLKRQERYLNTKVINVRTDNGMEFCHRDFSKFLEEKGINCERTNPYTPQQNGVSERFNLTVMDNVKAMLNSSGIHNKFWAEAASCFTYTWNRISHKNFTKTPLELYSGNKPSVSHLKVFGCTAYVGVPKQKRKKLDMRASLGIMMGYARRTRGYRIWLKDEGKLIETSNVRFNENLMGMGENKSNMVKFQDEEVDYSDDESMVKPEVSEPQMGKSNIKETVVKIEVSESQEEESDIEPDSVKNEPSTSISDGSNSEDSNNEEEESGENLMPCSSISWIRQVVPRKECFKVDIYYTIEGTKIRLKSPKNVKEYCSAHGIRFEKELFNFSRKDHSAGKVSELLKDKISDKAHPEANQVEIRIPKNYKEAIRSPEVKKWRDAMNEEINIIKERHVWDLVPRPKKQVLKNRWVYTTKLNEKGDIVRYKARLVAKGFSQIKGESYDEVYSPVVNFSIIRLFFSVLVGFLGWFHCQLDVKCAYLYANLSNSVYMDQPEGFFDSAKKDHVCLLKKALYGLHQSGREWYFELDSKLKELKFSKLEWCNCVYKRGKDVFLLVYVDDIIIFGKTKPFIDEVIDLLNSKFDLKVLGRTRKLLGIEFEESSKGLFIHQNSYISKVCQTFSEYNFKLSTLPIAKGCVLSKLDCPSNQAEISEMSNLPFRSLLGCLSFISNRTRPDISYSVNVLSQFQQNPGLRHWEALLKILGYLQYTNEYKLNLSGIKDLNIQCFSDSDFASNRDDRISMGGMVFFIDNTPISWRSFKQKSVSLSTMEAEYVALTESAKEVIWFKNVFLECKDIFNTSIKCIIYCDNQAAISFSNSSVENYRTKHIDVKYHFLRNLLYDKVFEVKFIKSKDNVADIFTKPMIKESLVSFCKRLSLL